MHKNHKARITALQELVRRVATITTSLDTPGIKLRFINFNPPEACADEFDDVRSLRDVARVLGRVKFRGKRTQLGTGLLRKVLEPLVYEELAAEGGLTRPVLVTTITDGAVCVCVCGCGVCTGLTENSRRGRTSTTSGTRLRSAIVRCASTGTARRVSGFLSGGADGRRLTDRCSGGVPGVSGRRRGGRRAFHQRAA